MTIQNKEYVLISGASSGIGRAIAIELSKIENIILHGRNVDKLNETKKQCSKDSEILIFSCNLNETENIEELLTDFIKENNIIITKFVHCAGYMKMIPLKSFSIQDINTTFNINVISAALIVKTLIHKKYNQSALNNVVFISSNISNMGAKAFSIYGATKSGLDGLMRNLAVELAPKVRVNSVLPGGIETEMTKTIYQDKESIDRIYAQYPLGQGNAQDIANVVSFLISNKGSWITGQQLTVDGGRSINITG